MSKIGTAYLEIEPDWSKVARARVPSSVSSRFDRYAKSVSSAEGRTSRLGAATQSTGRKLASAAKYAAGAAVAYLSISQAEAAIATTQDLAKTTISLNQNLGVGIHTASEWGSVLKARGVDTNKAGMAFKSFANQVEAAASGSASAKAEFDALGISSDELAKGQHNVQGLLFKTADGIDKLGAGTARTATEAKLFGRGWSTVAPLMRDGSAALKDNLAVTEKYGATLNAKTLPAQEKLISSQRESKIAWQGIQIQFTQAITPALIKAEDQFQRIARIMGDKRLTSDEKFQRIAKIIETDFDKALNFVVDQIPTIASRVGREAPKIAEGLVTGFMDADVWGKVALGAFFFHKLGLTGAIGRAAGKKIATTIGASVAGEVAAGEGATLLTAGGTAAGAIFGAAFVAAAAIALDKWLESIAGGGHEGGFGGPSLPGGNVSGATHIGALTLPFGGSAGGTDTAASSAAERRRRNRALIPPKVIADFKKGIAEIRHEYVNLGAAAGSMSAKQQTAWIEAAKAAEEKGLISRKEMRHDIDVFESWGGQAKRSGADVGKAAGDAADKTGDASHKIDHSWDFVSDSTRALARKFGGATGDIEHHATKDIGDAATGGTRGAHKLFRGVSSNVVSLSNAVASGLGIVKKNVNKSLGAFNVKPIDFALDVMQGDLGGFNAPPKREGGLAAIVPGASTGDRHLLALDDVPIARVDSTEGIFVGNPTLMRAMDAANRAIPRRAAGGPVSVPGDTAGLHPGILSLLRAMVPRFGGLVSSGVRAGDLDSLHHLGLAADYQPADWTGASRYANQVGPRLLEGIHAAPPGVNVSWDTGQDVPDSFFSAVWADHHSHIHLAVADGGKGFPGAMARKIKRVILKGPKGPLRDYGQAGLDKSRAAGNAYIAKHAPSFAGEAGTTLGPGFKGGQIVTASWYGPTAGQGPHPTGAGNVPMRGNMFAELDMGTALGGLPFGAKMRVGYRGRSLVGVKEDIGAGGPGLAGKHRAIDLWTEMADAFPGLKAAGLANVQVERLAKGGVAGTKPGGHGASSPGPSAPLYLRNWKLDPRWVKAVGAMRTIRGDENTLAENIDVATRTAAFFGSPGLIDPTTGAEIPGTGTELSPDERKGIIGLNRSLLLDYIHERNIALGTSGQLDRIIANKTLMGPGGIPPSGKVWIRKHAGALHARLTELQGITGHAGLIFDTTETLRGLHAPIDATDVSTPTGPDLSDLVANLQTLLSQANLMIAVRGIESSILPFAGSFAGAGPDGVVVPGPKGAPVAMIGHGGEVVSDGSPQPVVLYLIAEPGAGVDMSKMRAVAADAAQVEIRRASPGMIRPALAGARAMR